MTTRQRHCHCSGRPRKTRTGSRRNHAAPGLKTAAVPGAIETAIAVPIKIKKIGMRMWIVESFILYGSIFFPYNSGVLPTISPGNKHRDDYEHEHAVQARADTAVDDLA